MFGVSYNSWKDVCDMYFSLSEGTQKAYLQWFPFSKLTERDKNTLMSERFFNQYIKNGSFSLFPEVMRHSENYIQKGDGSFRNSTLISPLLYLVLQAIGKQISINYNSSRPIDISVFYAGNYDHSDQNTNKTMMIFTRLLILEQSGISIILKQTYQISSIISMSTNCYRE